MGIYVNLFGSVFFCFRYSLKAQRFLERAALIMSTSGKSRNLSAKPKSPQTFEKATKILLSEGGQLHVFAKYKINPNYEWKRI